MDAHSINFSQHKHNHGYCTESAVKRAREICVQRGVRLTELRARVLELIWQNHRPIGAYAILEILSAGSSKRVAPPTVYRALDFLLEQGFIHKIKVLNAFTGCPNPQVPHDHKSYFFICNRCGSATELYHEHLSIDVRSLSQAIGFNVESESLEVTGLCARCR